VLARPHLKDVRYSGALTTPHASCYKNAGSQPAFYVSHHPIVILSAAPGA